MKIKFINSILFFLYCSISFGQVKEDSIYLNGKYYTVGDSTISILQNNKTKSIYIGDSTFYIYIYRKYKNNNDSLVKAQYLKLFKSKLLHQGLCIEYKLGFPFRIYNYEKGKIDGQYLEFYDNHSLKTQTNMKDFVEDGVFTEYYSSGIIKGIGKMKNGLPIDNWKYFYENGQLEKKGAYLVIRLNKSNEEKYIDFINDSRNNSISIKVGKWIFYDQGQEIIKIENYKNGKIIK